MERVLCHALLVVPTQGTQQQVIRDADKLIALFGDRAYSEALVRARHEVDNVT